MTYKQDLEQQLHDRLESFAAGDLSAKDFIAFVKTTVLDSYHHRRRARGRRRKEAQLNPAGRSGATKNGAVATLRPIAPIISRSP
jgi:hypothetical protein